MSLMYHNFILLKKSMYYLFSMIITPLESQNITDNVRQLLKIFYGMHTNILFSPQHVLYYPNTDL